MCLNDVKHLLHIFLDCSFAKDCWKLMGMELDNTTFKSRPQWLLQSLTGEESEKMVHISEVFWDIWTARNMKVLENKSEISELALQ